MPKLSDAATDFASSLCDLTVNSKPLISMLTMLAEENQQCASEIVEVIEKHIYKVTPIFILCSSLGSLCSVPSLDSLCHNSCCNPFSGSPINKRIQTKGKSTASEQNNKWITFIQLVNNTTTSTSQRLIVVAITVVLVRSRTLKLNSYGRIT